jgi:N-acetylmuramoyl-L-alanine amidase
VSRRRRDRGLAVVAGACAAIVIAVVAAALTTHSGAHHSAAARTTTTPASRARPSTSTRASTSTTATTLAPTATHAPSTTRAATTTAPPPAPPASVTQGTGSLAAVAGRTIVLDPGHDGGNASHPSVINQPVFIGTETKTCNTVGTETVSGYPEHAYTFDVALRVRALLTAAGAHVLMTRSNDTGVGPCINVRAAVGNQAHAAAVVAIHADGGPAGGRGFCVYMPALVRGWTDDIYAASHRLGLALRDAYPGPSGIPASNYVCSGGVTESSGYGALNLSNVPAVLFETANARNAIDAAAMESAAGRQRIAAGIAAGLARFLAG